MQRDAQLVRVDKIPPGMVQVHFGSPETTWKPRGSLQKNSLSADLLERLRSKLESWTDPKYGDSREKAEAAAILVEGLREETEAAISEFQRVL